MCAGTREYIYCNYVNEVNDNSAQTLPDVKRMILYNLARRSSPLAPPEWPEKKAGLGQQLFSKFLEQAWPVTSLVPTSRSLVPSYCDNFTCP